MPEQYASKTCVTNCAVLPYIYGFLQDETGKAVYDAVQQSVDDARAEGAQYVIVLGHLGNEAECEPWTYADIIENTTGIDALPDGHSHDTDKDGLPSRIVRRSETNLGDLRADAFLDQSGADIAVVNGGGVRAGISAGDVTMNDLMRLYPFGNTMVVIEVTGQQVLDALEWGSREAPGELGGFLQASGLTYEIHTYIDSSCTQDADGMFIGVDGEYRVKNVMVGGEPLDTEKTYTPASSDHTLLNHGGGYTMFDDAPILPASGKPDVQALTDYITGTLGGVIGDEYADPYGQGRIAAVEEGL